MKTFHFFADTTFQAENIDDAFWKLHNHFGYLFCIDDDDNGGFEELEHTGQIEIKKVDA